MSLANVHILVATLNAAAHLERCLLSVERYAPGARCLVHDGGSSDGTVELLQRYEGLIDRWDSAPDRGVYDALNQMLEKVDDGWVYILGADDVLRPEWMEARERLRAPQTLYYGDVWMTHAERRYDGPFDARKLAHRNICQQAVFYPSAVFRRYRFNIDYGIQADWLLNMQCWSDPGFDFEFMPYCLADFEDQGGLSSNRQDEAFNRDYAQLIRKHFPFSVWWRPALLHTLGRCLRTIGLWK